jgi:hypothetical protein
MRDASEVANLLKGATIALGGLGLIADGIELVSDIIHEQAVSADLATLGRVGLATGLGTTAFHLLHKRLGARADELQNA